jgi:hypothetical protein
MAEQKKAPVKVKSGQGSSDKAPERPLEGEIVLIKVDNTPKEVLKYNQEGAILQFDADGFPELADDQVRELDYINKNCYLVALQALRMGNAARARNAEVNPDGEPIYRRLRVLGGTAANKLKPPEDMPPGMHWAPKRPDEVDEAEKEGYKKTGTLTSINGAPELIGMMIPEERYQEHIHAVAQISAARGTAKQAQTVDTLTKQGQAERVEDQTTYSTAVLPSEK